MIIKFILIILFRFRNIFWLFLGFVCQILILIYLGFVGLILVKLKFRKLFLWLIIYKMILFECQLILVIANSNSIETHLKYRWLNFLTNLIFTIISICIYTKFWHYSIKDRTCLCFIKQLLNFNSVRWFHFAFVKCFIDCLSELVLPQ